MITLGKIRLEIEPEKTRRFYQSARPLTEGCSCGGCVNYAAVTERLPQEIADFFARLGIDPAKPAEIMTWYAEDDGKSVFYGGFYHLCGKMLSDSDCWEYNAEGNCGHVNEDKLFAVTENFSVGFTNAVALPEEGLPEPVLQMEIFVHHAPWVIPQPNTY